MIEKRFGFAKIYRGDFETPFLLKCGEDIKFKDDYFLFLDKKIKRKVLYPPSIIQREIKIDENTYLIPNVLDMLRNTKNFVDYTVGIREKYGYDKLFYAPGIPSSLYPPMVYLGYDIFDDCYDNMQGNGEGEKIIEEVKHHLRDGDFRDFLDGVLNLKGREIIRYLDTNYYEKQEIFYPIWNKKMNIFSLESIYRVDVERWRRRLKERYKKPDYGKYLLLLPCSARKPYSISTTHRKIREKVKGTMHEVIITSPLGIVPRELEMFYPAQNYDVPTIGHWYEEEKKMIENILSWYLENFKYDMIISYLPENMRFLEHLFKERDVVSIWGNKLDELEKITVDLNYHVPWKNVVLENLKSVARFQFGTGEELFKNAIIRGRYPRINIYKGEKRVFGFNIEKGMLTLTELSADYLMKMSRYTVFIDDFYPQGDVFSVGVTDATKDIREGDEVVVVYDNELRAWGTARINYYDMINEKEGKAVKVRGKIFIQ